MGPEGEEIDSVATITVPTNNQLSVIHDRMPAILDGEAMERWLDVRDVRAEEARQLALPLPDNVLSYRPVSTRVNSAAVDEPSLIEAVRTELAEPTAPVRRKAAGAGAQLDLF